MKTEKLYDINSYTMEFTATVLECEEYFENWAVVLDRTAFFPEAGGQPSDIGNIDNTDVLDVQIKDDKIIHITREPLPVGSMVMGTIDWKRRFDFMQQHSAEHIVSGVAHNLYGCENVGFHLSEDICTLDFDKSLTREQILEIEKIANRTVFANKEILTYYPSEDELKRITYRSKKELEGAVRIVEIEDTDMCACCAPHVKATGEIGIIKLLSSEKLRGGVRIELKAGMRALADFNERYNNTAKIGDLLAVKYNETAEATERLIKANAELKAVITALKRKITEQKVAAFNPITSISAEFEDGLDIKEMQIYADALFKKAGGIRGVFSSTNTDSLTFAICGQADALNEFFTDFKSAFEIRGGGRNGMVQGTVFGKCQDIKSFFSKRG